MMKPGMEWFAANAHNGSALECALSKDQLPNTDFDEILAKREQERQKELPAMSEPNEKKTA